MRARVPLALLLVGGFALTGMQGVGGRALAATTVPKFYPDLTPVQLDTGTTDVYIAHSGNGTKLLRFAFKSENAGTGPIELRPKKQDCNGNGSTTDDRTAFQDIYGDTNTNGEYDPPGSAVPDQVVRSRKVGCFVFDPAHGHWHFKNYAKYSLLDSTGTKVGGRSKVGFCLIDDTRVDAGLPGSPPSRVYFDCNDLALQGTSVGWDDVYGPSLSGQSIVVQGLPDGSYCLVARIDPKGVLRETDVTDNQVRTPIDIAGDAAQVTSGTC
jgi:lysyl oxidase